MSTTADELYPLLIPNLNREVILVKPVKSSVYSNYSTSIDNTNTSTHKYYKEEKLDRFQ